LHKKENPVLEAIAAQSAQQHGMQIELTRICLGCKEDTPYVFQKQEIPADRFDPPLESGFICTVCDYFETLESSYDEYRANNE
tara:strand:+ start:189 stop:437 length:249 start_codon:yes stop_codon:yes gene_type:complete